MMPPRIAPLCRAIGGPTFPLKLSKKSRIPGSAGRRLHHGRFSHHPSPFISADRRGADLRLPGNSRHVKDGRPFPESVASSAITAFRRPTTSIRCDASAASKPATHWHRDARPTAKNEGRQNEGKLHCHRSTPRPSDPPTSAIPTGCRENPCRTPSAQST